MKKDEDEFVKTNTQSSHRNHEKEIHMLNNKAKQLVINSKVYQTFDFMKADKIKSIPTSSDYINTVSSYGNEGFKNATQPRRKRFFNFKNLNVLQKQLTVFNKMSKNEQEEILIRELEDDPPRNIALKKAKPVKKINNGFFNKAKAKN
jgi:hypothetical protein